MSSFQKIMDQTKVQPSCDHKCHKEGCELNPWIKFCPVCGCKNEHYDPEAVMPDWMKERGK